MNKYIPYNQCIIRTPLFPINYIDKIEDFELSIFQQSFKEAVYIATPVLYQELYIKNNINERTINSAIKYYVRSCTRCTPYGIFAGCDIVPIRIDDNYSNIIMSDLKNYKTYTRIDMNYLCELIRKLDLMPQIQNAITYHVNTTSYFLGKNLRYIEYRINKSKRNYTFSEISHTPYLNNIIKALKKTPLTKKEIIRLLIKNKEIEEEEALNFVQTLIDEQILISNLEPSVVGEDLIQQLHHNLSEINYNLEFINSLIYLLKECDKESLGNKESIINNIYRLLSDGMLFEQDTLMQVDTLNKVKQGIIGNNITKVIDKCIYFFSKFQPSHKSETFELFKRRFYEKYEEQEVPLVVALDPQVGIGYGNWTENNGDINPLLQGLPNPFLDRSYKIDMDLTPVTMLLIKKYEEAIKQGITGKVFVSAIIEKDGRMDSIEVAYGKHPLLKAEALRLVKKMPRWEPGRHQGELKRVSVVIPVNFTREMLDSLQNKNGIFCYVTEEMPVFPHKSLQEYIAERIEYPIEAREQKIEGKVFVSFVVDTSGLVDNVKVMKSVHPLLDAEAIRIIQALPRWEPGKMRGEKARVHYVVPVNFTLEK